MTLRNFIFLSVRIDFKCSFTTISYTAFLNTTKLIQPIILQNDILKCSPDSCMSHIQQKIAHHGTHFHFKKIGDKVQKWNWQFLQHMQFLATHATKDSHQQCTVRLNQNFIPSDQTNKINTKWQANYDTFRFYHLDLYDKIKSRKRRPYLVKLEVHTKVTPTTLCWPTVKYQTSF